MNKWNQYIGLLANFDCFLLFIFVNRDSANIANDKNDEFSAYVSCWGGFWESAATGSEDTSAARSLSNSVMYATIEQPDNAIAGKCVNSLPVNRNLKHKWGLSREAYRPSTYPPYCAGPAYALTRSAVSLLLNQTHNTPLIHLEDVSVGILAKTAGNIPKWLIKWNWKIENPEIYRKYNTIHIF